MHTNLFDFCGEMTGHVCERNAVGLKGEDNWSYCTGVQLQMSSSGICFISLTISWRRRQRVTSRQQITKSL